MDIMGFMQLKEVDLSLVIGKKGDLLEDKVILYIWEHKEYVYKWILNYIVGINLIELLLDCDKILRQKSSPSELLPTFDNEENYDKQYYMDLLFSYNLLSVICNILNTNLKDDIELSFIFCV